MSDCKLEAARGNEAEPCHGSECPFWRVADHVGRSGPGEGCAIEHFRLVEGDAEMVAWLLSVKRRLDDQNDVA